MSQKPKPQRTSELLRVLRDGGVEFVLIGGVAAIVHGSTRMTSDLDVAMPFTRANMSRLIELLRAHEPVHGNRPDLSLLNDPLERLCSFRLLLIDTNLGRLDAMPDVPPLGPFDGLDTVVCEIFGAPCTVFPVKR